MTGHKCALQNRLKPILSIPSILSENNHQSNQRNPYLGSRRLVGRLHELRMGRLGRCWHALVAVFEFFLVGVGADFLGEWP